MSGELPSADRASLEYHLAACTACQRYQDEMSSVTALLAVGDELYPEVEPGKAAEMRWARDFEAAIEPAHSFTARVARGFLDWTRDMVFPCRRIWAGLVAVCVLVLSLNAWQSAKEDAQDSHRPPPEMIRALLVREGFLSGSSRAGADRGTEPPRPTSLQPQSKQHRESKPS